MGACVGLCVGAWLGSLVGLVEIVGECIGALDGNFVGWCVCTASEIPRNISHTTLKNNTCCMLPGKDPNMMNLY